MPSEIRTPFTLLWLMIVVLLLYSNWRTAKQLEREHNLRVNAISNVENSLSKCQPSVYLSASSNPIDAIPSLRYRDNETGRACVFLNDGRYGLLWWSNIHEDKVKSHLEWQFQEIGHYKW